MLYTLLSSYRNSPNNLFLSEISGGFERGIMTKERVGPDSGCLINVPFDSILTVDFAKNTCFMELLQTDLLEDDLLSLLLLFEKFNKKTRCSVEAITVSYWRI